MNKLHQLTPFYNTSFKEDFNQDIYRKIKILLTLNP